jgi:hypothetical protein
MIETLDGMSLSTIDIDSKMLIAANNAILPSESSRLLGRTPFISFRRTAAASTIAWKI